MKVTIVDRSQKSALRKTRQILCCYLDRVGSETYIGNISQDGMTELRKKLLESKAITKIASISCYLHRGGRLPELIWTLGSKNNISEDGHYAYKRKSKSRKDKRLKSPLMEYMKVAVWLAGLFHDLGKGTVGFQDKLKRAIESPQDYSGSQDPIRHEVISAVLLDVSNPEEFLKKISNYRETKIAFKDRADFLSGDIAKIFFESVLKKCIEISEKDSNDLSDIDLGLFHSKLCLNSEKRWLENPLWQSIIWLVFTHHKLPNGNWYSRDQMYSSSLSNHVGLRFGESKISNIEKLDDFLKMKEKDQPWDHNEWIRSVNRAVSKITELREEYPEFEKQMFCGFKKKTSWMSALVRVGRMSLVMADYEASCNAVKEITIPKFDYKVFANTKDKDGVKYFADPLHVHLRKVGEISPQIIQRLLINRDNQFIEAVHLESFEIPRQLQIPAMIEKNRFEWQSHVQRSMLEYRDCDKGFFCVVAAGTGRGKTRACAAILTNSRKNPRFTVGLSMRSLTYQTAKTYVDDRIGFNPDHVSMMVGDAVLKRKFRDEKSKARLRILNSVGTDNILLDESEEQYSIISSNSQNATMSLKSLKEDHFLIRLLSSPITIMTIDHIVRLVDLSRSKDVVQFLHLMETDLILDEVDDYKGNDIIVIGRLIELMGLFGRRVVIASATLPKIIVEGYRNCYLSGYKVYQDIYSAPSPDTMIITHLSPFVGKYESLKDGEFGNYYLKVMSMFVEEEANFAKSENRRVTRTLSAKNSFYSVGHNRYNLRAGNSEEVNKNSQNDYFGVATVGIIALHKQNFLIDESTGINYSIGFFRLNSVVNSQRYIKWQRDCFKGSKLSKYMDDNGIELKFMCYHAQTIGLSRVVQEQFLERHLNRSCMNDGDKDPFLSSDDVIYSLNSAKKKYKKHVIFVVVTTSIMETGRDYDFDWTLLEPCSTTSVVQSGGRVRRHRTSGTNGWNIYLMPMSFNATMQGRGAWRDLRDKRFALTFTPCEKIADMLSSLGILSVHACSRNPDTVSGAMPADLSRGVLHAGFALIDPKDYAVAPLTSMERVSQMSLISEENTFEDIRHVSLGYAINHVDAILSSRFYRETRFRGGNNSTHIELYRENGSWITEDKSGKINIIDHLIYENYTRDSDNIYFLSSLNIENRDQLMNFSKRVAHHLGYGAYDMEVADSNLLGFSKDIDFERRLIFEPQLGFYEEVKG